MFVDLHNTWFYPDWTTFLNWIYWNFVHCIGDDNYNIEKPLIYMSSKTLIRVSQSITPQEMSQDELLERIPKNNYNNKREMVCVLTAVQHQWTHPYISYSSTSTDLFSFHWPGSLHLFTEFISNSISGTIHNISCCSTITDLFSFHWTGSFHLLNS